MQLPEELLYLVHGTSSDTLGIALLKQGSDAPKQLLHRTARVWTNFSQSYELSGHSQAVWAVLAIKDTEFITGDHLI
jgi:hypothetical protein